MLQDRQIDRMILKMQRLQSMYEGHLVSRVIHPEVTVEINGVRTPATEGMQWGKDFATATFSFTVQGILEGEKYYLTAQTGAPEHLVCVNGKKVGILDYIAPADAFEPPARTHRYLYLDGLKNGDCVSLEGYYSHTMPGLHPYDQKSTFSYAGYQPNRPYQSISLVSMNEPLRALHEKMILLGHLYQSEKDGFAKAHIEKTYLALFKLLPVEEVIPNAETLAAAEAIIDALFAGGKKIPYVGIVGHSHLDTAWLWTVEETKRKLMRTVSNAVEMLRRYPEYTFFMSTVLYLKWIEDADPVLFSEVEKYIKEGRFEVNGATWVECDGNLTGSEAFCRQFLRGKRYLRQKFGYESDTFWLPDTFGYSAALPQIMKKSGVDYFLTTKLSWNDTNMFPYETFLWRGIDGSTVPVHFNSIHTWIDEESVSARLEAIRNKRESDNVLMAYGFGDGGGGPSAEMVSRAIFTEKNAHRAKVEHTTVSNFMKKVSANELPEYFGELYLELHRGTYTTNHNLKMYNRRLEEALHDAELISVLKNDREAKTLTDGLYDTLMLNQFHDILPGTCIAEATDVALAEQAAALTKAKDYISGKGKKGKKSYFNTLPHSRLEILSTDSGQAYEALDGMRVVAPYKFEGCGYGKKVKGSGKIPFTVQGDTVKTPFLEATFTEGKISSLIYGGRELARGGIHLIKAYEDVPFIYDNWDIDVDYRLKEKPVKFLGREVITVGEYLLVVRITHAIAENSLLVTDVKFRYDSPQIEFENHLTAGDLHTLIRAEHDTTLFAQSYKCETQFGNLLRNSYNREKSDIAKFEVCAHKWTDLSEQGMGISLLSDVKYGVSCQGGRLGITLHKSGTHPDARGDRGESYFGYALYPHEGGLSMDTVERGYNFNYAPVRTSHQELEAPFRLVGEGSVILETVKQGEDDGIVLRLYEALGATSSVTLIAPQKEMISTNILEDEEATLGRGEVTLTFSPFEIKTIKLK